MHLFPFRYIIEGVAWVAMGVGEREERKSRQIRKSYDYEQKVYACIIMHRSLVLQGSIFNTTVQGRRKTVWYRGAL